MDTSRVNAQGIVSLQQLPVDTLPGVSPALAIKLAKLNIRSVQDILFYLPFRYQDRTRVVPMRDIRAGDYVMLEGKVVTSQLTLGKRRQLIVYLSDGSATVELRFFYFNAQQKASFKADTRIRCFGEIRFWQHSYRIIHPEYQILTGDDPKAVDTTLTPLYASTQGLSQIKWRQLTSQALAVLVAQTTATEYLPDPVLKRFAWLPLVQALHYVHRPPMDASIDLLLTGKHPAQQRLAFEELLAHHLSLRKLRHEYQQHRATALPCEVEKERLFLAHLGFSLTGAQRKVWQEIAGDLFMAKPMLRLVQGDVGSGKTVIAALAALRAIQQGGQVALMAPTELLAEQHLHQFQQWFAPLNISVDFLAAKLGPKARRQTYENIALGTSQIIIGTHALFQQRVHFNRLNLVIIDEQHRFGVQQRLALREKGSSAEIYPHQLLMTATPIPRTLAMVSYADLDISAIDELPPGRIPINTLVVNNQRRGEIAERASILCAQGGQVYWVCPLITESEELAYEAAETKVEALRQLLPHWPIGLIHGRLNSQEKIQLMTAFKNDELKILVATTVIEVGVNVPNATLMVIENAERLGLAQLHQLRGRVGRGQQQSYCVLLYQAPLAPIAKQRLAILRNTQDGFIIAQKDLALRGAGEILSTRQTGTQGYRIANFWRDQDLLSSVKQTTLWLEQQQPEKINPLIERWIGSNEQFINA